MQRPFFATKTQRPKEIQGMVSLCFVSYNNRAPGIILFVGCVSCDQDDSMSAAGYGFLSCSGTVVPCFFVCWRFTVTLAQSINIPC